jgi:hypothetical protein
MLLNESKSASTTHSGKLSRRPLLDRPAVRQPRQVIRSRRFFQEPVFLLDLAVQIDNSSPHADTRQEFTRVERLGEIIIRSRSQSFHDAVFFRHAGQQNDVSVGALRIGPDTLAKLRPGRVRQHPVRDDHRWPAFLEETQRFLAAFCKKERVGLVRERMLQELSRHGRIVHHQNLDPVSELVHSVLGVDARMRTARHPTSLRKRGLGFILANV